MIDLLKKDGFIWSSAAELAFQHLKQVMTTSHILALPNFQLPFVLETHASGYGIGVLLQQVGSPIAFLIKDLCLTNQALSIYEREFLAVFIDVQKWNNYLQAHKFIIKIDQQ